MNGVQDEEKGEDVGARRDGAQRTRRRSGADEKDVKQGVSDDSTDDGEARRYSFGKNCRAHHRERRRGRKNRIRGDSRAGGEERARSESDDQDIAAIQRNLSIIIRLIIDNRFVIRNVVVVSLGEIGNERKVEQRKDIIRGDARRKRLWTQSQRRRDGDVIQPPTHIFRRQSRHQFPRIPVFEENAPPMTAAKDERTPDDGADARTQRSDDKRRRHRRRTLHRIFQIPSEQQHRRRRERTQTL